MSLAIPALPPFTGSGIKSYLNRIDEKNPNWTGIQKITLFYQFSTPFVIDLIRHDPTFKTHDWQMFRQALISKFSNITFDTNGDGSSNDNHMYILKNSRKYYVSPGTLYAMSREYRDNERDKPFCSNYIKKLIAFSKAFYLYGKKLYDRDELTWSDMILLFLGSLEDYIRLAILEGYKNSKDNDVIINKRQRISNEQATKWFKQIEITFQTAYKYSLQLIDATMNEVPNEQYEVLASSWRRHSKSKNFDITDFYKLWEEVTSTAIEKKQISIEYGFVTLIKCLPRRFAENALYLIVGYCSIKEFYDENFIPYGQQLADKSLIFFQDIIPIIKKNYGTVDFQHLLYYTITKLYISTSFLQDSIDEFISRPNTLLSKPTPETSFMVNCPLTSKVKDKLPSLNKEFNTTCSHSFIRPTHDGPFYLCNNVRRFSNGEPNPYFNEYYSTSFESMDNDQLIEEKASLVSLLDNNQTSKIEYPFRISFIINNWKQITNRMIRSNHMTPKEQYYLALIIIPEKIREVLLSSFHPYIVSEFLIYSSLITENKYYSNNIIEYFDKLSDTLLYYDIQPERLNQVVQKFELLWWKEGSLKAISSDEILSPKIPNSRRVQLRCKFCDEYSHQMKDCPRYYEYSDAFGLIISNQGRPNEYVQYTKTLQQFKPTNPGEGGIMRSPSFIQFLKSEEDLVKSMDVY